VLRLVLEEGLILTFSGMAAGVAMSFGRGGANRAIRPLYTVTITWRGSPSPPSSRWPERSSARFTRHGGR